METHGKNKDIKVTEIKKLDWELSKIVDIKSISPTVKLFSLKTEKNYTIEPGQHFDIKLVSSSGYEAQRSYSVIAKSSTTNEIDFAISKINDGEVSNYMHEKLQISQKIYIRGPIGKYFNLKKHIAKSVILIAGGIGITPFIYFLRKQNYQHKTTLIYSAKNNNEYLFRDELENKNTLNENFNLIVTLTKEQKQNWNGLRIRINSAILKKEMKAHYSLKTTYFICGGSSFVENISSKIVKLGVEHQQIKLERFGP